MALALGVLACLLAAAALLAIPVDLRLRAQEGSEPASLRVEWLFGWLSGELLGRSRRRPRRARGASAGPGVRDVIEVWNAEVQEKALALLRRLRGSVRVRELRARLRFGLGDPADTGRAWAAIAPLALAARAWPNVALRIDPDFFESGLHGEAHAAVRVHPLRALPSLLRFGCSPAIVRAAQTLRARRQ